MSRESLDRNGGVQEPIYLSLGFHDHQPAGNFEWVFAKHYERAYLPFLETMERHPTLPFSLHLTGPLLLWLTSERPGYLTRLEALVAAGRLELKGGGFYEPILALIPDADKGEQLRRMTRFLLEELGSRPTGAWIAERVWEPHLALHLADAGLEYAVLDDAHFIAAGIPADETFGYYVTEEQGRRFDLFPISKELRYLIPFRQPEEILTHLYEVREQRLGKLAVGESRAQRPPVLVVYDDDGEKFGGWPGTHEHVYGSGWFERFLTALENAQREGWLRLTTPAEFRRRFAPLGRAYLPTGSYSEMLEWSGGFFRNFLVRYEEANLLHKRMLYTSGRVRARLEALGVTSASGGLADSATASDRLAGTAHPDRPAELRQTLLARDHVLRSQCNDAYWHGVFGGLYLPHLRHAAYADLLTAERLLGEAAGPVREVLDLDLDGYDEIILRSPDLVALIRPACGGALAALDHLPTAFALLDTLRRRREPEHAVLEALAAAEADLSTRSAVSVAVSPEVSTEPEAAPHTIHEGVRMKEPGLERLLYVDTCRRGGFVDHFFAADTTVAELHEGRATELGDFHEGPYRITGPDERESSRDPVAVRMERRGNVAGWTVMVRKSYILGPKGPAGAPANSELTVTYSLTVEEQAPGALRGDSALVAGDPPPTPGQTLFCPELDVTLLAGWAHDRYALVDGERAEAPFLADIATHHEARSVTLVDESRGVAVEVSWEASTRSTPPDTVARSVSTGQPGPDAAHSRPVAAVLNRYGIVTVSVSEDGFERIYQGTALVPGWVVPLVPGARLDVVVRVGVAST